MRMPNVDRDRVIVSSSHGNKWEAESMASGIPRDPFSQWGPSKCFSFISIGDSWLAPRSKSHQNLRQPRQRGSGDSHPRPGRPRCPSGLQKCPSRPLLWPSLSRRASSSGTIGRRAFRTVPLGTSQQLDSSCTTEAGDPVSDFHHDPRCPSSYGPSSQPPQSVSHRIPVLWACSKHVRHIDVRVALFGPMQTGSSRQML
jgi:hypothetical protein